MIAARRYTMFNPMPEIVLESFRKEMARLPMLFFSEEPASMSTAASARN
jgi:hypothetical protein